MPTNLYGPNDNFSEVDSHVIPGLMFRMEKAKKKIILLLVFGEVENR